MMLIGTVIGFVIGFSGGEDATSCLLFETTFRQENQSARLDPLCAPYLDWGCAAVEGENLVVSLAMNDPALGSRELPRGPLAQSNYLENRGKMVIDADGPLADVGDHVVVALGEMAKPYHPIIVKAAHRNQVDPALIKAVIMAESAYDPQAVSSEGAAGLMQLMPRTAEALGVEDVFNAENNVNGGVKYLKQLLDEFNQDIELALAAYNVGSGTVRRHQGIPPGKETESYIQKVFGYYYLYKKEAAQQAGHV